LRTDIADYLITEWWPTQPSADLDQQLYNDAADCAFDTFHPAMQLFLDLGWTPGQIAEHALNFCGADLDLPMIEEIKRLRAERVAHTADDEEEEGDEEDGQPRVRDITPAFDKALAEYAAGALSPKREAAILSLLGDDFFTAVQGNKP
jgi:hypothetical protein